MLLSQRAKFKLQPPAARQQQQQQPRTAAALQDTHDRTIAPWPLLTAVTTAAAPLRAYVYVAPGTPRDAPRLLHASKRARSALLLLLLPQLAPGDIDAV